MDQDRTIHGLKSLPMYATTMEKLYVKPSDLDNKEKTFLLTVALLLLRKYQKDRRVTSFVELAYHIILRYSLAFGDYIPLYDFSVNIGFYPIAQAITQEKRIEFEDIASSLIPVRIQEEYERNGIIETYDQKQSRESILAEKAQDICYIAPTSFGKSALIIDHIQENLNGKTKVAIIVPSKSLLMQTYRDVRKRNLRTKIIIHDEMYMGQEQFIAVFTQERALRLMDKHDLSFDILYIDEAHRILDRDSRSLMISRLIKLNRKRNVQSEIIYLSPLISDATSLQMYPGQDISERRIRFNMKDPDYFEYVEDGGAFKYNRFLDSFYKIGKYSDLFTYIQSFAMRKNFCYLYSPRKIEHFAIELAGHLPDISSVVIDEIISNLEKYVHKDFLGIELLRKGIVYLHGKMPEPIKDYLEFKFSTVPELKFLVANKVILEGVNMPIDALFVLNGTNMQEKDLINLIGRVNRLDQVFTSPVHLEKLLPQVHFVNSDFYNRNKGKLRNKLRLLKKTECQDKIRNPVLSKFDMNAAVAAGDDVAKCSELLEVEQIFFAEPDNQIAFLKKRIVTLGINTIYELDDDLCRRIYGKIKNLRQQDTSQIHFLDRLQFVFVSGLEDYINDKEFLRLNNVQAIAYYKKYYQDRKKSLRDSILSELTYFQRRISNNDCRMYIGESYGEIPYSNTGADAHKNVYVDLSSKSSSDLVNIAIVKLKMEDDFTAFKLKMFFQLMFEYQLLTQKEYQEIMYGTTDEKKIELSKMGLSINLVNRLDEDGQLKNIEFDDNGNLFTLSDFEDYRRKADDYYRFELNRFL
jgi:hypothetical protein